MLTGWFALNRSDEAARGLLYIEIPLHYTWNKQAKRYVS
jgi:hypothetical protein